MKSENISNPEESKDKMLDLQAETDNIKQYLVSLLINWKWIVLSLIVCLGMGVAYVRYTNTVYSISEKVLIKTGDNNSGSSLKSQNMGFMSMSDGFDNELEILSTHTLAKQVVRDLNLFVSYYSVGNLKSTLLYKDPTCKRRHRHWRCRETESLLHGGGGACRLRLQHHCP